MIRNDQLIKIGTLTKPHGIKGEIAATLDYELNLSDLKCIVISIDGINVPFFISGVRPKSVETILLSIDGITDESLAKSLCGSDYFALRDDVEIDESENGGYISDFIGYVVRTPDGNSIGTITDYDDSTENLLFIVERPDGNRQYIPVAEDLLIDIDNASRFIIMSLPDGLFDL